MTSNSGSMTLADIACLAGVSTATVSRVVSGKGGVSAEMHQRVQQVIEANGYKPQRVHKKAGGELWVAVLAERMISPFFAPVLAAIQDQAQEFGYAALVLQMGGNDDRTAELLSRLGQFPWAGVISAGYYLSPQAWVDLRETLGIPMVLFNQQVEHPGVAVLRMNFERATITAIQHLLDLGHTRIAYIGDAANEFSNAELRGVEIALQEHGVTYPDEYRISVPHTAEGASQGVHRILLLPPELRPTALMAFDDEFAIHVLNALGYYGLRVPQDISVLGFDNIPMAANTSPPLTTIDVPKYRIGQQMIVLLRQLISGQSRIPVGQVILEGTLVVRGSTGPVN